MSNTTLIDNKTGLICGECGDIAYVSVGSLARNLYCLNCAYELNLINISVKKSSNADIESTIGDLMINVNESFNTDIESTIGDYLDYLEKTTFSTHIP